MAAIDPLASHTVIQKLYTLRELNYNYDMNSNYVSVFDLPKNMYM